MNKICQGCGIKLQDSNPSAVGFTPNLSNELCQRCFRLVHYDDLIVDLRESIEPLDVLKEVEKLEGLILWVVDLFDLTGSLKLPINRYLANRDIILVATKRDLLPYTLGANKLGSFILRQLKENNLRVKGVVVLANKATDGIDELKMAIDKYSINNKVILIGNANSGKSTLLKALVERGVTISKYPGTTLAISAYQKDDLVVYDTPGLTNNGSFLQYIANEDLATILPKSFKKIQTFQIFQEQSFAIGGLVRIDCLKVDKASVSFYLADTLKVHRGKVSMADELWSKHYNELLTPTIKEYSDFKTHYFNKGKDKVDICINGLGFVSINGDVEQIQVMVNNKIDITIRKGMI